ncbi:helix-turn-helix transcriptional regulator [Roseovarius sp.]|uniref:helix-turn-helix domain-containing protein n=1 Tax=Roseovarius sp. TaxID=1486281 RepID=UPI001B6EA3F3|nr:helix-turn-helix transcriptional regulator [Roseovarius sp.]MBQ0812294.1 helix-turn-helix transcriptional regulator [Roseovarius sp.]
MTASTDKAARTKGSAVHPSIARGIARLGQDISRARRARRISTTDMAARMGVGRSTLHRLEQGDPGVSLNTLAMALSVLGLFDRLADLVDPASDELGLMLAEKTLPRNISRRRRAPSEKRQGPAAQSADDAPEGW